MYELKREELEQEKKKNLEKPVFYVRGKGGWSQELKEREIIKKKKKERFPLSQHVSLAVSSTLQKEKEKKKKGNTHWRCGRTDKEEARLGSRLIRTSRGPSAS